MIKAMEAVLLGSQNAKKLGEFYKTKVGLKLTGDYEMGDENENLYVFEMKNSSNLYIIDHSKVKGKNKEPGRIILNFEVDDIEKEVARLKKAGIKLIQDIYHVEDYGRIATFEDLDGNYFQLVQVKE